MTDNVYIIVAEDMADKWIHTIFMDELTAEQTCARLRTDDKSCEYHVEEHELYG